MTRRRAFLAGLPLAGLLAGCSTLVPAPNLAPSTAQVANAAWARVLWRFVNPHGEVDFEALSIERGDLDTYVRHVSDTALEELPDGPERLAHMTNAYDALSMFNVLQSGIPTTHAGFNKLSFFVFRRLDIGGQPMSLPSFENDLTRPLARRRNDPRIHFALNCSALSCSVLPRMPFTAAGLDAELERETQAFFARPENFRIDTPSGTLWLSELLDFYTEDFVPNPAVSLLHNANCYALRPAPPNLVVRFTPYDWTIANSRRAR